MIDRWMKFWGFGPYDNMREMDALWLRRLIACALVIAITWIVIFGYSWLA